MSSPLYILAWSFVLFISLFILLKSADYFVVNASLLGEKFNIPSFIIGATVVAFGTSLPELAVGVISVLQDESDIVTGTAMGSNISNIFLILGLAILTSSGFIIKIKKLKVEFFLLALSTVLVASFLWDKKFELHEALISLGLLLFYLIYVVKFSKSIDTKKSKTPEAVDLKRYVLFILSFMGVWLGAKYTTEAITNISGMLGLGSDVISQTVVALGTSLPELAVTVVAARKKQFGMILGNVMGSNLFNLLAVLAIPAIIGIATDHPYLVKDDSFNQFSIPLMVGATTLLIIASFFTKTPKYIGILFVILYIFFMIGSFIKINLLGLLG